MCLVKYSTAVARLRSCAVDLDRLAGFTDEPLVLEAWVFGELLELPDELEVVSLALVIDLPAQDVTWRARPTPAEAAAALLHFEKYPLRWFWRPSVWPVWNHAIERAVRFWSQAGTDTTALDALAHGDVAVLRVVRPPSAGALREQLVIEHEAARDHLRDVLERYDDREWQHDHHGFGLRPEDHLWCAAQGFLDLDAALRTQDRESSAGSHPH
jgi:hypothetical protein